ASGVRSSANRVSSTRSASPSRLAARCSIAAISRARMAVVVSARMARVGVFRRGVGGRGAGNRGDFHAAVFCTTGFVGVGADRLLRTEGGGEYRVGGHAGGDQRAGDGEGALGGELPVVRELAV